jgi:hypothetical protein
MKAYIAVMYLAIAVQYSCTQLLYLLLLSRAQLCSVQVQQSNDQ